MQQLFLQLLHLQVLQKYMQVVKQHGSFLETTYPAVTSLMRVDCTCTGSPLQWFLLHTQQSSEHLGITDDDGYHLLAREIASQLDEGSEEMTFEVNARLLSK